MARAQQNLLSLSLVMLTLGASGMVSPAVAEGVALKPAAFEAGAASNQADGSFDDVQSKAFIMVMSGNLQDSRKLVEGAIKEEKGNARRRTNLYYLLSAIEFMDEEYKKAISHLDIVREAMPAPVTQADHLNHILLLKRLGDCYYAERDTEPALAQYRTALLECSALPPDNRVAPGLLESITGTLVFEKKYAEAQSSCKQLLDLTTKLAKPDQIEDVAALFWARIQMLIIYRNLGSEKERQKLLSESIPMLDQVLQLRAQIDAADKLPDLEKLKTEFEQRYIKAYHPTNPGEYLWLASEFKMRTLPLIQWPSKTGPAKAAILCIHGLGLENRAFTAFGREMAGRGYSVYALDVRGFGSWQTSQGHEDVQFNETLRDIGTVLRLIKEREHGLPVFLLGESMGGAIALRGAAQQGDLIAGCISSVPSAERFQQKRMTLSVAYHLLQGANKPFRVGDMVTNQATKNENLAEMWKNDSKAKMDMSPKELIKFAIFMRSTKGECEKISTPVFIIQGLGDHLVKPEGTYQLFDAVKASDKDFFLIGNAEHLIFETFKPSKILMDALCTWIDEHAAAASKPANSNQVTLQR